MNFGGWTASPGDSACFGFDCSRTFKYDFDDHFWFDSVSGCPTICLSTVKRRSCPGNPNLWNLGGVPSVCKSTVCT